MKVTERTSTYALTFHDLQDELGIRAKKILGAKVLREEGELDENCLELTVVEVLEGE